MFKKLPTLIATLIVTISLQSQTISLTQFSSGFSNPIEITNAGDSRLFVAQQGGLIRIIESNGTVLTTPFLNISSIISSGGERGLLGLAFHPNYSENGFFYVNYTRQSDGATVIARYTKSENPNIADAASGTILLVISQPFSNHNGGCIKFGTDGYLYIGMGDGGSGGDPGNRGQDITTNLGKILRIDVDNGTPYSIPATNPFLNADGNDEILLTGLRNPWKFSFDRQSGDLWIADVGQNAIEEINRLTAPITPGLNLGWRCYEGNVPYNTDGCPDAANLFMPNTQYTHGATGGCSITGGYVYRGSSYPSFQGKYFFADYCKPQIATYEAGGTIVWNTVGFSGNITTFGEDQNGELYVNKGGTIYKITDPNMSTTDFGLQGFTAFPNPANQNGITIKSNNQKTIASYQLFDQAGRMVAQNNLSNPSSELLIPTQELASGMYLLHLKDSNGNSFKNKIIIE